MGIYGQDWASYQSTTPDTTGLAFAFVKITEGLGYVNPKWPAQRSHAKANGLVWGGYHYPHMGNSVQAEGDYFLGQVNWQPGDLICLDWEGYDAANQGVPKSQQAAYKDAWLRYVKRRQPYSPVGMYCNVDYWRNVDTSSYFGDFLWIATAGRFAGDPGIQAPWLFHQYSDSGVDHDYCHLPSAQALRDWSLSFRPGPSPTPAPPSPTPTPSEDDMPQQIVGTIPAGATATTLLPPVGSAWTAYKNRAFHLGYDEVGTPDAVATVRVAFHDGKQWGGIQTVKVTAGGPRVDVPGITPSTDKISVESDKPVGYAIETW